jgi:hypothetical protein
MRLLKARFVTTALPFALFPGSFAASGVVGCSVDVAPTQERSAAVSAALGPNYSQSVDLANQAVVFTAPAGTSRVDVHFTINGTRNTNVRMMQSGATYRVGPLALRPDDQLSYYFTYLVGTVQTTTPTFNYAVPLTFQPLALLARVDPGASANDYVIHLASTTPITWADVHYTINGGTQQNFRMPASGTHVTLKTGDALHYSMTYSAGTFVLETAASDYVPTAAAFGYTWVLESAATPPSAPGACTTTDGTTFSCPPWALSKISADGGYQSTSTSGLVPVTVTFADSTYQKGNFTTLAVGFTYHGGTPRTGTGLVLIPTASDNSGNPPASTADALAGKNVSATPGFASNFMVGGTGLAVAMIDINGIWSNKADVASHVLPGSCDRPNCFLNVPMSDLTQGSTVDLTQIRYVAFITEPGATVDPTLLIGDARFEVLD